MGIDDFGQVCWSQQSDINWTPCSPVPHVAWAVWTGPRPRRRAAGETWGPDSSRRRAAGRDPLPRCVRRTAALRTLPRCTPSWHSWVVWRRRLWWERASCMEGGKGTQITPCASDKPTCHFGVTAWPSRLEGRPPWRHWIWCCRCWRPTGGSHTHDVVKVMKELKQWGFMRLRCVLWFLVHFLRITRSSEVLRKSRVRDWILE